MEPRQRLVIMSSAGIILLLLLVAGIWWLRTRDPGASWQGAAISTNQESEKTQKTNSTSTRASAEPVVYPADADHDGVSDADEKTRGTDPNNADTDRDGHTDFEEIYVAGTNPLQVDPPRPYLGTAPTPAPR